MKIKFSNFVKLFLAGASLLAVGCTDYGQDIQNLNDRIDKLETDAIEPLKVDLKAIQDDLAAAKDDLQKKIDANTTLINGVNDDLKTAKENIAANKTAVDAVKGDLEKTDALVATINGQVATLVENVAALADKDAEFAKTIEQLQLAISNNTAAIEELKAKDKSLEEALNTHVKTYEALVLALQTEVNVLKGQVKDLQDKDAQIDETIAKIDDRLKANEELAKQNKTDLDAAVATLGILQDAHKALDGRVGTIETELKEHYAAFETAVERITTLETTQADHANRIAAAEAAIETLKTDVGTLKTDLAQAQSDLADLTNELSDYKEKMKKALEERDGKIQANADAIKKLTDELLPALEQRLTDAINAAKTALEAQITALQGNLDALKARIQSLVFVPEHVDGAATILWSQLTGDNNAKAIVESQSVLKFQVYPAECAGAISAEELTFVLTGELATTRGGDEPALNVVKVATTDKAGVIAVTVNARNLGQSFYDGDVTYATSLVFNGKTGAEEKSEANIASSYVNLAPATADELTVKLVNDTAEQYTIEYVDTEKSHVVLPDHAFEFSVNGEVKGDIAKIRELGYDVVVTKAAPAYEFNATGLLPDVFKCVVDESNPDLNFVTVSIDETKSLDDRKGAVGGVKTVKYSYNVCGKTLNANGSVRIIKTQGFMTLDEKTITWSRSEDNDATDKITAKVPTSRLVATAAQTLLNSKGEEHTNANTSYAELLAVAPANVTVNGEALAAPYNVVFGKDAENNPTVLFEGFEWNKTYTIKADFELANIVVTLDVTLNTVQATDEVVLADQTITWNYAQDKESEKGAATFRAVATTADKADVYAEVIADGVAENPVAGFVFTADGVEATDFTWNQEYPLEVTFALENKRVTVKTNIKTVKTIEPITIDLEDAQWSLTKEFVNQSETPAESLAPVYEKLNNLGDITADAYLKDIFVDNAYTVVANTANAEDKTNTKLAIDATAGNTINSVYNIDDYATAIPAKIDYVLTVTTWYNQEITFKKTLNIGLTPVEITLAEETKDIAKDLQFTTAAESLAAIYEKVTNVDKTSIATADDYLKAIFVTNTLRAKNETVNAATLADSKVAVEPTTGATATATYNYAEFTATPDQLAYVSKYTTWYGQEIVITKVVNIKKNIDTYDFEYVPSWVFTDPYESRVTPEYTYTNATKMNASSFSLKNIKLREAFLVKDSKGNILDDAALAALGITLEYAIEDTDVASSLLDKLSHVFEYKSKKDYIYVGGHLYLATGVGSEVIELPTKFDKGGVYADYRIKGYNPIEDHITATTTDAANNTLLYIKLEEAKKYETNVWSLLSLKDKRGFELFENGAWVEGNDDNGFADKVKPCDPAIYNAEINFQVIDTDLPAELKSKVEVTPETGILSFDYTNKFELTKAVDVPVKVTVTHEYGKTLETTLVYKVQAAQ